MCTPQSYQGVSQITSFGSRPVMTVVDYHLHVHQQHKAEHRLFSCAAALHVQRVTTFQLCAENNVFFGLHRAAGCTCDVSHA